MRSETGEAAFHNVEELLTEKIVNHSRRHSERAEEDKAAQTVHPQYEQKLCKYEMKCRNFCKLFFAGIVITATAVLFLLYHLYHRLSERRS